MEIHIFYDICTFSVVQQLGIIKGQILKGQTQARFIYFPFSAPIITTCDCTLQQNTSSSSLTPEVM